MRVIPISLLSGLIRRKPSSHCYMVPALASSTSSSISHSEKAKEGNFVSQMRLTPRATSSWRFYTISALNSDLSDSEPQVNHFDFDFSKLSEYSALRVLRDDPSLALSFLRQLKKQGVPLNVDAYATVVRILSSLGLDRKLDSVLVELIGNEDRGFCLMDLLAAIGEEAEEDKRSFMLLTRVSSALVKAYVSLGMFDEAIDVLFQSNRLGCVLSIKACNFLMNRLVESRKNDMVVALFYQLKQLGLCANDYTYDIVVKALCRKGDLEAAAKLLDETRSVFGYKTFIGGLCANRKTETARFLIKELIDRKVLACDDDIRTVYTMVVRGFCNERNVEAAEQVVFEMEKNGISPGIDPFSMLIDRHCKDLNLQKALEALHEITRRGLKINCVIVSSILHCYCKMGMFLEALQKFQEYRDVMNVFLDRVCYNVAFDALGKLGRVEEAVELLREMMDKGMVPDVINYTTLIDGYCLQGKVVDARDLLDEMGRNGTPPPDVNTYNALAGGLARNRHAKEAFDIYKLMKKEGVKPNADTHNVIIEGLCFAKQVDVAEDFFKSLEHKCPENYASLVKGYCESGLPEKAFRLVARLNFPLRKGVYFKLFTSLLCREEGCGDKATSPYKKGFVDKALAVMKSMWVYGVEPGASMYGKMIGALSGEDKAREAQLLFEEMITRKLTPDLYTCTIMVHIYSRLNELEKAEALFDDMKQEKGTKPDVVTYTVLLDTYLKKLRDHETEDSVQRQVLEKKSSDIWRELNSDGVVPDVVSYTVLIDSLCKIRKQENATRLLDQMIDRGLKPDNVTYTALLTGCCRRKGYIDKALVAQPSRREDISPTAHLVDAVTRATFNTKRFRRRK